MLTAERVNELKKQIKTEMARRNGYGSLSSNSGYDFVSPGENVNYAGPDFDFTDPPDAGDIIVAEHGEKTVDLLLLVNDHGDLKK